MEIKTKARRWGNSMAIILPKLFVDANKVRENDDLEIEIKKNALVTGELFGKFPEWKSKKSPQKLKEEMKKGWA